MAKDAEFLADLAFPDIVDADMEEVNLVGEVGLCGPSTMGLLSCQICHQLA